MSLNLKKIVLDAYASLMHSTGKTNYTKHCSNRLVILTFHRCLPEKYRREYPYPGLVITPEELNWLLAQLKHDFQIGSVSTMVETFYSSHNTKPMLALSFDDGQWDNYNYAIPVLNKNGVQATFYICTDHIDRQQLIWHDLIGFACMYYNNCQKQQADWLAILPSSVKGYAFSFSKLVTGLKQVSPKERENLSKWVMHNIPRDYWPEWARLLNWEEVQKIISLGHEIGSHGCSHAILPQLSGEELYYEINHSKERLELKINNPIQSLCYPNGDFDEECILLAEKAGYTNAVTTQWGHNHRHGERCTLKRMDVNPLHHRTFFNQLSIARTKLRLTNQYPGM